MRLSKRQKGGKMESLVEFYITRYVSACCRRDTLKEGERRRQNQGFGLPKGPFEVAKGA